MKQIIATLLFISICLYCKSQQNMEYGLQLGLNLNSAHGYSVESDNKKTLLGINAGGYFKWNSSEKFGLKGMLLLNERGFAFRNLLIEYPGGGVGDGDIELKSGWLNLYILPEFSFGNNIRFTLAAGPYAGALLHNKLTTKFNDVSIGGNPGSVSRKSESLESFDYGLAAAAGIQFPFGKKLKWLFEIRNDFGLANVFNENGKATLNSFAISTGMVFSLK